MGVLLCVWVRTCDRDGDQMLGLIFNEILHLGFWAQSLGRVRFWAKSLNSFHSGSRFKYLRTKYLTFFVTYCTKQNLIKTARFKFIWFLYTYNTKMAVNWKNVNVFLMDYHTILQNYKTNLNKVFCIMILVIVFKSVVNPNKRVLVSPDPLITRFSKFYYRCNLT